MYRMLLLSMIAFVMFVSQAQAHRDRIDSMSTAQVYKAAQKAINHGGIRSIRHGGATPYLTRLCYELVQRAFQPYGTQGWALYVVSRESDCNPGAVNTTYSSWREQAQGIAQIIPKYHTWINYTRLKHDIRYAVRVFVRMSRGGRNVGPWSCPC